MPKNNIRDHSIFDRINRSIKNFTWSKCLSYPHQDDRMKYCNVLFSSKLEIKRCEKDFCGSCCDSFVDLTNKTHKMLCRKQCQISKIGNKDSDLNTCIVPLHQDNSVYPYCDETFPKDVYGRSRCKTDMCNLCCVSLDSKNTNPNVSDNEVNKCYEKCLISKIFF